MGRFLLDTGLLLGFARRANGARRIYDKYRMGEAETVVATSIVCHGEIISLATRRGWAKEKRQRLEETLKEFQTIDINLPKVLRAYAQIDAWTQSKWVDSQSSPPLKPAKKMGKNDLWVAATAHAMQATLLSTDKDFSHLNGKWFSFTYIDRKDMQV